jgi:hypothetical protein
MVALAGTCYEQKLSPGEVELAPLFWDCHSPTFGEFIVIAPGSQVSVPVPFGAHQVGAW